MTGEWWQAAAKPLSLEYIADRMDVDDPLKGYVVPIADAEGVGGHSPSCCVLRFGPRIQD